MKYSSIKKPTPSSLSKRLQSLTTTNKSYTLTLRENSIMKKLTWSFPLHTASINLRPVPWKGRVPDNRMWRSTPAAHISTALPYCLLSTTSGAINDGQPTRPAGNARMLRIRDKKAERGAIGSSRSSFWLIRNRMRRCEREVKIVKKEYLACTL